LERKAELDGNYANMLEHIITKDYVRNTNNSIASQALYAKLVEIMLEEPPRVRDMAGALKEEADKMNNFIESESNELKKMLESANKISKEIQSQREKLEKSKAKYDKRN
jgi:light-regulated signal transduction histidine kinase (bacteriophytochrome)